MADAMFVRFDMFEISFSFRRRKARIFVVHGHDLDAKKLVVEFLEDLDLTPIVLHERPNEGKTIIEKFEKNTRASLAVVLLTPDDIGYQKGQSEQAQGRARQNVVFELGYFIGKLGRDRVCALYREGVEMPSDFGGIAYVPLSHTEEWKRLLAREIKNAGISVNLDRAFLGLREAF